MFSNGCQIGEPHIGLFADRIKPNPLHIELYIYLPIVSIFRILKQHVETGLVKPIQH